METTKRINGGTRFPGDSQIGKLHAPALVEKVVSVTDTQFRNFVESRQDEFRGVHPHSVAELDRFELELGQPLPKTMRWLLETFGYSKYCGVDNLEESVLQTLDCRESISLPNNWMLLNDWGDGGVVLLDFRSGRICWCGAHNAHNLSQGEIDSDSDWFDGYPAWVADRVDRFGD